MDVFPNIPQEHLDKLHSTGATVKDEIVLLGNGSKERQITFWWNEYNLGYLYVCYEYANQGEVVGIRGWHWNIDTRVLMDVKYKFTKTKAQPNIEISTKFSKTFESDQIDKVVEWLKLMVLWLKTAEAKKQKIMIDVEFEP